MKVFFGDRQTGRTTKLIKEFQKDPNGFLVVCNEQEKGRIISLCLHGHNDYSKTILTYAQFIDGEFLKGYSGSRKPILYIDDGFELMKKIIFESFCDYGAMTILGSCVECQKRI